MLLVLLTYQMRHQTNIKRVSTFTKMTGLWWIQYPYVISFIFANVSKPKQTPSHQLRSNTLTVCPAHPPTYYRTVVFVQYWLLAVSTAWRIALSSHGGLRKNKTPRQYNATFRWYKLLKIRVLFASEKEHLVVVQLTK